MKKQILIGGCVLLTGVLGALAGPKESVIDAAHKLAESSYGFTSTPKDDGGGGGKGFQLGPTEGAVDKSGLVRLTREMGPITSESFVKGDKAVTKTPEGWKTIEELFASAKQGGGGGGKGKGRGGLFAAIGLRNYKSPAEQAADFAENAKNLRESDGMFSGDISESTVKGLMSFGRGGKGPEIEEPKGSVKFWVKDGALEKYEFNVQGKIGDRNINRTITIRIKDVGTAKVTIPDEAKSKLD